MEPPAGRPSSHPPLSPPTRIRTGASGNNSAMARTPMWVIAASLLAVLIFAPSTTASYEPSDNDLVFDDDLSISSKHLTAPKVALLHPSEVAMPDYQMDDPLPAPGKKRVCRTEVITEKPAFFWGKPKTKEVEICEEVDASVEESDHDKGAEATEGAATPLRRHTRQTEPTYDDDLDTRVDDEDMEGSGLPEGSADETSSTAEPKVETTTTPVVYSGGQQFYRILLNVNEPFRDEMKDRTSDAFKLIEQNITHAVDELYKTTPGRQSSTLIKIEKADDIFFSTVTLDLGTLGYNDTDALRQILEKQIRDYHSIGEIKVSSDGFIFRPIRALIFHSPVQSCPEGQMPCSSSGCVAVEARCDGNNDCPDGSDEKGCGDDLPESATGSSELSATDPPRPPPTTQKPVKVQGVEDGEEDGWTTEPPQQPTRRPEDDSEETTTTESEGGLVVPVPTQAPLDRCRADDKVRCKDGSAFICTDQVCDGKSDCADGSDEVGCPPTETVCAPDEFACDTSRCIHKTQVCDGEVQCSDGKDELNCPGVPSSTAPPPPTRPPPTRGPVCHEDEFQCRDGRCIEENLRCDGTRDCPDGEDEDRCPCDDDEFNCMDGTCVDSTKKCDGHHDCPDASDEKGCEATTVCGQGQFRCRNGSCIRGELRCDQKYDCVDGSDEHSCSIPCPSGDFRCDNGVCIERDRQCNKVYDCNDRSDERNCLSICTPFEFKCRNGECISEELRCNSQYDCSDRSDEENCDRRPPCQLDEFACNDGTCLNIAQRCNNVAECLTGEDEQNCAQCSDAEYRCNDGRCIDLRHHCDGRNDCGDLSDEEGCGALAPCPESDFTCSDGSCIPKSQRCDGYLNCPTGVDEVNCENCLADEFRCRDGSCIKKEFRCDLIPDCKDNEDEEDCDSVDSTCPPDGFFCDGRKCLQKSKKCDGIFDCVDGSDERDCGSCPPGDFLCPEGICLTGDKRCDGIADCRDASDERECVSTCRPTEFRCNDGFCVDQVLRCNGHSECRDGSDELNCIDEKCKEDQFQCDDGLCIAASFRCDGFKDCVDGKDEANCTTTCRLNEFLCPDLKTCVPEQKRCDRARDCPDGSDELGCPSTGRCSSNEFLCADQRTCVSEYKRCDRIRDCPDGSDESNCAGRCQANELLCPDQRTCFPEYKVCDKVRDCPDGWDESTCPETCSSDEFTCRDGSCIDSRRRCDRRRDCRDGSDEFGCDCRSNEFRCASGDCIPLQYRCNRRYDCADGSDERDCQPTTTPPAPVRCGSREYLCRPTGQCLSINTRCDGKTDCPDYTDESNCAESREGLNLKTYPPDQIIKEIGKDREVVFQCRDEGPARARVKWLRGDGAPMPPGSRDLNGRLEMPNIQLSHTGTYICEAVGYPESTPGSRVSVYLKVEPAEQPPIRQPEACAMHEATCNNRECIPKSQVCDGTPDCSDGSDEMRCSPHGCEPNEFRCENKKCVLKTWRCDSDDDCGDGSDERGCVAIPGSPCRYNEHQCRSGGQCIPKSFHCDGETDCHDGSDEVGCSLAVIVTPPQPMLMVNVGETFVITCKAVGVPTPEIVWRLNWGHVPSKCSSTSVDGFGTLTCPRAEESDQGAYSCEAVNVRGGSIFAIPDCILQVKPIRDSCEVGFFKPDPVKEECLSCFCFGVTSDCSRANLYVHQLPPPINVYKLVGVRMEPGSRANVEILPSLQSRFGQPEIQPLSSNGFSAYQSQPNERTLIENNVIPYFSMPESYHGNLLKSYGGYLKYRVKSDGQGKYLDAPDVIISGNGYTLVHPGRKIVAGRNQDVSVRFFYGEWYKWIAARPGGDIPERPDGELASREEIMMALANVDYLLIRAMYDNGNHLDTTISNIAMDTADAANVGLGVANYVEECRCPPAYYGLSCEKCAPGYQHVKSGSWLGSCVLAESCEQGYYGDPARGLACQVCPCPLTTPSNQFGRTCILDTDNQPTCRCPPGYVGRRCERCAEGYEGNPLVPGSSCRRIREQCSPIGSLTSYPDARGQCLCKENVYGVLCDQCKPNTFYLSAENTYGCLSCFCMGITNQCQSSPWYRDKISTTFSSSSLNFKLVRKGQGEITQNITEGIRVNSGTREITFSDFPRGSDGSEVHYWALPDQFLGDKVTSYGGYLTFTLRYVPAPGGQRSRNNAPIVEIISWNNLHLLYYGGQSVEPDKSETIRIPIVERDWERLDSKPVDRANFLMALADVKAILIKAAYTTNTREAALQSVSLDIAVDRNTGLERAFAVEYCTCPRGYIGHSCEDCAPGYTRDDSGIYLGRCQPCQCNGHSDDCDPESGVCRNCRDNTWGERCQECRPGFSGDATNRNIGCTRASERECRCDSRGSAQPGCPTGNQCVCKPNVQGTYCEECRPGSFGLSENLALGCHECFCSGVTTQCQSSTEHYRIQIPMQIGVSGYEFMLTDSTRREVTITDGFTTDVSRNEIGYSFPPVGITGRSQRLFWSLPSPFTGNKVTSYGGKLTLTQRYISRSGASEYSDTDVIITGGGITLFWKNPMETRPNQPFTYSVPLFESEWRHLDQSVPRPASRADLMTVLIKLEAILVRATFSSDTEYTYLSDVSMDSSVVGRYQPSSLTTANDIEKCYCPPGYEGTSCESCAQGYYLDFNNRGEGVFGTCRPCPCNNNEESCSLVREGNEYVVRCRCKPGYDEKDFCAVGIILSDSIQLSLSTINTRPSYGQRVEFTCSVNNNRPLRLEFTEIYAQGFQVPQSLLRSRSESTVRHSYSFTFRPEIKGLVCTAYDESGIELARAFSYISRVSREAYYESSSIETVRPTGAPPPRQPTISVSINEPTILIVEVGGSVRYRCSGRSLRAQIPVKISWSKEGGVLPPGRSQDDGQGVLVITDLRPSDSGAYLCEVTDGESVATERAVLTVGAPSRGPSVTVYPSGHQIVSEGSPVEFRCEGSGSPLPTLQWSRVHGGQLNPTAVFRDGMFRITSVRKSDEAEYVCTGRSPGGTASEKVVLYVRADETASKPEPVPPVRIEPQSFEGNAGDTVRLSCSAAHDRRATVRWTRDGNELPATAGLTDGGTTLTIYSATAADSGVYICATMTPSGETVKAQAVVNIISFRSPPTVRIEPDRQTIPQGTLAELRCLASGDPTPSIRWSKAAQELGSNVQIIGQLFRLNNAQVSDRGVYVCTAQNSGGTAQASAIIEVERRQAPSIELYPEARQVVQRGGSALVQCRITDGIPTPKLTWTRIDGNPFSPNVEELPGGVLRFNQVTGPETGQYQCRAENEAGSTSAIAYLEMQTLPVITLKYPGSHSDGGRAQYRVKPGQRVRMECTADGDPTPTVSWNRLQSGYPYSPGETKESAVFEITQASPSDSGTYTCEARNVLGTTQERVQLIVDSEEVGNEVDHEQGGYPSGRQPYPPNSGVLLNNEKFTVLEGGSVTMRCTVRDNRERIFLTWVRASPGVMPADNLVKDGVLHMNNVRRDAAGEYICQGIGQSGNTLFTASAHLEVIAPPRIKLNPVRQVARPGDNVYISCSATGDQPISLNWVKQDGPLPRSVMVDGGSLHFRGIEVSDAGHYRCIARNSAGEADGVANIIVTGSLPFFPKETISQFPPPIERQQVVQATQQDVTTYAGSSVELKCSIMPGTRVTWARDGGLPLPRRYREREDPQSGVSILELGRVTEEDGGRYFCHAESALGTSSDFVDLRVERERKQLFYCLRHEFQCRTGKCIPAEKRCDRRIDCPDSSDEIQCRYPRGLNDIALHIDTSQEIIRIGDTVDIRCDVSGDPNAVVSWSKAGEEFASNIQTRANLLRVNNVNPRNGGVYTCTAKTSAGVYKEDYVLTIQGTNDLSPSETDGQRTTTPYPFPIETRSAPYGSAVVMECRTDLDPPVTHVWSRQGGFLPKDAIVDRDTLKIPIVQPSDAGIYVCTAMSDSVKMEIPTVLVIKDVIPRFDQNPVSFMSLPPLPGAYLQFSIEISFKPESPDGLILYNGQNSGGTGDFVSFGLSGGHPELRFDVGSGPANIRAPEPVTMGEWHTVKLERNLRKGSMYVDGAGPYTGSTSGRFQGLDLEDPLYIGGVPDFATIRSAAGFTQGFVGCISRLVVGDKEHNLVRDATSRDGVNSCDTCASAEANHCHNNGICQEASTANGFVCICPSGFSGEQCEMVGEACFPGACHNGGTCMNGDGGLKCLCPMGKKGQRCEEDVAIQTPSFPSDGGYVAYPTPKALKRLKLNVQVKPRQLSDGLLLYCAQSEDGVGDFTSLTLNNGRVEFRYDVGSGTAILRSNKALELDRWVTIVAGRDGREGFLSVDGEETVSGKSPGSTRGLNLKTPLYIGGYNREKVQIASGVGLAADRHGHIPTFVGCVLEVEVSGTYLDLIQSAVESANVVDCADGGHVGGGLSGRIGGGEHGGHSSSAEHENEIFPATRVNKNPCESAPCHNDALCLPAAHDPNDYECHCSIGFRGRNCETSDSVCDSLRPCQNGGTCVSSSPSVYHCACSLGYAGKNCEQRIDFTESVGFQGDGYLELSAELLPHKNHFELESIIIEFSTTSSDGILFWHGQGPETDGRNHDYISIAVVGGFLEFSYEMGSGPALITLDQARVDDGKRHRAVFHREGKDGSIELDRNEVKIGESQGILTMLNAAGNIYLGGVPNARLMTVGKHNDGFSGCIHSIDIQNSGPLNLREKALSGVNAHPCSKVWWVPSSLVFHQSGGTTTARGGNGGFGSFGDNSYEVGSSVRGAPAAASTSRCCTAHCSLLLVMVLATVLFSSPLPPPTLAPPNSQVPRKWSAKRMHHLLRAKIW
ncbi:basement membrane-specific heparan sulfate proteoglycan core protein-like isoform X3 [Ischnura elegans]|uniref:basement membrane-specific heparan sulfate proteoglycan core protein-like isoform X3 n=1 Tax=Ischnura elegans TaxID=197161 RepID=UPI001ED8944E|nr:basement membrane-specific heparan sulfate proteoglycan core protein-like isoform X3 [Ischnura elegans]